MTIPLHELLAHIQPPDPRTSDMVRREFDQRMPQGTGLGFLRDLLIRYAGITNCSTPAQLHKYTILCCADHGIASQGVSAYPPETTQKMVRNYLISQGAAVNAMASFAQSQLWVCDLGMNESMDIPGLNQHRIAAGTADFTQGPAMSRAQAIQALETGIGLAEHACQQGGNCFLPAEMAIGNTTSSAAITAAICALRPEDAAGRGSNISDARLQTKITAIQQALKVNQPNPQDGIDILAKLGGFELGCIAGIILGAAAHHALVILNGFNTTAAALIAQTLHPAVKDYLFVSQLSEEPAHLPALKFLSLDTPGLKLQVHFGETVTSSLLADCLDSIILAYAALCQPTEEQLNDASLFFHEIMPPQVRPVSTHTMDFYLRTLPTLNIDSMKACQRRINRLSKPFESLGCLEMICRELAGILEDERPAFHMKKALLCFTGNNGFSPVQRQLTAAFAKHADADVTITHLHTDRPPAEAWSFGHQIAEDITFDIPIIGIALTETLPTDCFGTKSSTLRQALCRADGSLRYGAEDFLEHVPPALQTDIAAVIGAIFAAAHNSSLVILDNEAVDIIARYAELLCPKIRPYILHTQPALLQLDITAGGGCIASLGIRIVTAALQLLNQMKTFSETRVCAAIDGPGQKCQDY